MTAPSNARLQHREARTVLESNGALWSSDAYVKLTTNITNTSAEKFPAAVLDLTFTPAATLSDPDPQIHIHLRALDVDGTADEPQPSSDYNGGYADSIPLFKIQSASQLYSRLFELIDKKDGNQVFEVWLHNASGQDISAGWTAGVRFATDYGKA